MYSIHDLMFQFFIVTVLLYGTGAAPNVKSNNERCVGRSASCETNAGPRRALCGTDGRTYPTRCHLLRAQCAGEPVALARKGPCAGMFILQSNNERCVGRSASCETNTGPRRALCGTDGRTYPTRCHLLRAQCAGEPVALARKGPCAGMFILQSNNERCVGRSASCETNTGPRRALCGTDGRTYPTRCHLLRAQCAGEPVALARKGPCAGMFILQSNNERCVGRSASCETNASPRRALCGTDGRTYPTRCHLLRAQCAGEPVALAQKGPCAEGQSSCLIALRYALNGQGGRRANFVPRCRADGTYAAVQCAAAGAGAAGCWCVTPDGKPLQDTAVRNGRPDCTNTGCSRADRVLFNANLIKIFSVEYERARSVSGAHEPRAVADWKFGELDRDKSGALQKSEYRGLRRLIKKVVKPKRCARAWARGCDGDGNGEIALTEWASCLLANPEPPAPDYEDSGPEPELDYGEEEPPQDPSAVLPGNIRHSFAPDGSEAESHREDEANDCLTDRQAVLDEQKAGAAALYVPECTGDGRYARAQCYRSTGYCWCVHQDTGKPIPGSSVKDRRPDCDAAPHHASPMRGCPEPMKSNFLRDLMRFFITKMAATTNGTGPGEIVKWGASKEEQAATWTYVMLDKDKNKALERREWKSFHQLIANMEPLRRCGRKLPRYCDINHDAKITITEWMACLEVTQLPLSQTTEPAKVTNPRRKGPNPLESILKADD